MKVTLIMATTVDGFIGRTPNHFTDWTDIEDKHFFHEKTKELGVIVMGSNTWRTLPGPFEGRLTVVMSTAGDLADSIPGTLEFFSGEPAELIKNLSERGFEQIALVGGGQVAASFLLDDLIDEMFITITPLVFGRGVNVFVGHDFETKLELVDSRVIGDGSVLLHYTVIKQS